MAAPCTTACPTSSSFPFEPTFGPSTFANFPASWYGFDFPASKTYSSIFNKETPCPVPSSAPFNYPTPTGYPTMMPSTPFSGFPVSTPAPYMPSGYPANWNMTPFNNWFNTPYFNTPYCPATGFPSTWMPSTPFSTEAMTPFSFRNTWFNTPSTFNTPNNWWSNTLNTLCNVGFRPSNPIEFYCLTNPIRVLDREGNRCLFLAFDCRGFKPEEVTVTLNKAEKAIIVEATHDVKDGKEHQVMRKFYRKFCFPTTLSKVDFSKCEIKSCLTAEGMLTVECPLPKMTTEEIAACPVMSRNFTTGPFTAPLNNYFGCPSTCNTAPITTKVC